MIMTTEDPPLDADEVPTLPDGLLEAALAGPGDPRRNPALLALFQCMLPYAMMLIRTAFDDTKPRRKTAPTTSQIRELVSAQHVPLPDDDPGLEDPVVRAEITKRTQEAIICATEAALASAVESFHTHGKKEFASAHIALQSWPCTWSGSHTTGTSRVVATMLDLPARPKAAAVPTRKGRFPIAGRIGGPIPPPKRNCAIFSKSSGGSLTEL